MKFIKFPLALILFNLAANAPAIGQTWHRAKAPLETRWAVQVSPANALPEYPRPQMARASWLNLNGLWSYAITQKDTTMPTAFDGQILVPYPIESALSGVKKALQPSENLWYKRTFTYGGNKRTLLHFGAVDFEATVYINGKEVGKHTGGYTEFSFDITNKLKQGPNEIAVKVWDPSDQGYGPHGKQVLSPANIYYTPTSGIWQTVWLESVPDRYIDHLSITPDIDKKQVRVIVHSAGNASVTLSVAGKTVTGKANTDIIIPINNMHLWSVGDPYLYDLNVKLGTDEVKSYIGMRKISILKDTSGTDRIALNNRPYFNLGTLDQGFWPDGLYTAPTDEALAFDIKAIKAMGFNTIRKHIKIEPARWYYYCDKLGILVWQDFVNPNQGLPEGAKAAFEKQVAEQLVQLHNYPCITTWVLFNEKWGQYDQERLTNWVKKTDPERLVNGHSGEYLYVNDQLRSPSPNAYVGADITDVHSYPYPMISIRQSGKAQVCGEFGGIGVFIPGHQWNTKAAWGYVDEKPAALVNKYRIMNQQLELFHKQGLSGSIYTQPFDVEGEQNGLMTYDREIIKVPLETLRSIHHLLNPDAEINIPQIRVQNADLTDPELTFSQLFQKYLDGQKDTALLRKLTIGASQQGDKVLATQVAEELIKQLKGPYDSDDLQLIAQFTASTQDTGFHIIWTNRTRFYELLGERKYELMLMNMIYRGEIEPLINAAGGNPDWSAISIATSKFGAPGEEILLRAETIHYYNHQDWPAYKKAAETYLAKFGSKLPENERGMFKAAIDQHQ